MTEKPKLKVEFGGTGKTITGILLWGLIALLSQRITFSLEIAGIILFTVFAIEVIEHLFKAVFYIIQK